MGLEVSTRYFTQNRFVQFGVGNGPFEPSVLMLKILESVSLIGLNSAVVFTPLIVGLLRNTDRLTELRHRLPLRTLNLSCAKFQDDLVGCKSFVWHDLLPWFGHSQSSLLL